MKKLTAALLFVMIVTLSFGVFADSTVSLPVTLCCSDDVYSVDFVFAVEGGGTITACTVADKTCLSDWNFVDSDARLYLSLASAESMKKYKTLAEFSAEGGVTLKPISVKINGKAEDISCLSHGAETDKPDTLPTCDAPGGKGGKICSICGVTLKEHSIEIPATGPQISSTLSTGGTLTVSGAVSDSETTENCVMLGIYNDSKLLDCVDISNKPQNKLNVEIENMQGADTVKIFRWSSLSSMAPLYGAVEVEVK